jgi:chaperone required for assembly of F1-ATPase
MTLRRTYAHAYAEGCVIMLDDKPLITPAGNICNVPTAALAGIVAAEWQAQEKTLKPSSMPFTQMVFTALDRIATHRAAVIDDVARYLETELVCHYSDRNAVSALQRQRWQPLHDWLQRRFNITLPITTALAPITSIDIAWAATHVATYDDFRLCALQVAVHTAGSFAIGLALVEGAVDAIAATSAAEVEADAQAAEWGADADTQTRRDAVQNELVLVENFIKLLKKES